MKKFKLGILNLFIIVLTVYISFNDGGLLLLIKSNPMIAPYSVLLIMILIFVAIIGLSFYEHLNKDYNNFMSFVNNQRTFWFLGYLLFPIATLMFFVFIYQLYNYYVGLKDFSELNLELAIHYMIATLMAYYLIRGNKFYKFANRIIFKIIQQKD